MEIWNKKKYLKEAVNLVDFLHYLCVSNFRVKEAYKILISEEEKILSLIGGIKEFDEEIGNKLQTNFYDLKRKMKSLLDEGLGEFTCIKIFNGKELTYIS
ncbi:MAG: hypothetical protein DRP00_02855 [Candidatus Aenigmatarchaeota archaeon]|nr:MAG: hypothetical protein DRP00_02855 [Candidatus Aenigmarchaeota archaeon]